MKEIVLIILLSILHEIKGQMGTYCSVITRKDLREIWYIQRLSSLCKDNFFSTGSPPDTLPGQLSISVKNSVMSVYYKNQYLDIDQNFVSEFYRNVSISIYDPTSSVPRFLSFIRIPLQDVSNSTSVGKLYFQEEGSGMNLRYRWLLFVYPNDISNEGIGGNVTLTAIITVSILVVLILGVFHVWGIDYSFIINYLCLTIILRIVFDAYINYYGYIATALGVCLPSFFFCMTLKWFQSSHYASISLGTIISLFYIIAQIEYLYLVAPFGILGAILLFFILRRLKYTDDIWSVLALSWLSSLTLSNWYENPYISFMKVRTYKLGYDAGYGLPLLIAEGAIAINIINLIVLTVGQKLRKADEVRRLQVKTAVEYHYDLITPASSSADQMLAHQEQVDGMLKDELHKELVKE